MMRLPNGLVAALLVLPSGGYLAFFFGLQLSLISVAVLLAYYRAPRSLRSAYGGEVR